MPATTIQYRSHKEWEKAKQSYIDDNGSDDINDWLEDNPDPKTPKFRQVIPNNPLTRWDNTLKSSTHMIKPEKSTDCSALQSLHIVKKNNTKTKHSRPRSLSNRLCVLYRRKNRRRV